MCKNSSKFDAILNNQKVSDILAATKLNEIIKKKEEPVKEKKNVLLIVLAIIGAVTAIAAIAYAVYRHVTPKYMDEFDDEFEDDFDFDDSDDDDLDELEDTTTC